MGSGGETYSLKCNDFIFHNYIIYFGCHKTTLKRGGSNIKYPDWLKNKKTTCFHGILRSVHKPKFKLYVAFNINLLSPHWF